MPEYAITVPVHWDVTHACGHTVQADLAHKKADERAGFARWLAGRDCTDCWRASTADSRDTSAWLAERRASELAEADAWAEKFRMPALDGTPRAVAWAARCRHRLITDAYASLVVDGNLGDPGWEDVEEAARSVTRAGWWIDNRESAPADLPELLAAATGSDRPNENPF